MVDYELDELKREFLDEARGKVDDMQAALDGGGADSLERLAYLAHQLKGSGGSYGYQSISDNAAELEKLIESLEGTAGNGNGNSQANLMRYVTQLRTEIDHAARELAG
jgi:HPt (histidine-containing phosphotransfer) domain-containing protein